MRQVIGLNLILGVWLSASPFAFGFYTLSPSATWNDVIVGLAIAGCSWCVVQHFPGQALCSSCALIMGAWLMMAPFVLTDYADAFRYDTVIGGVVVSICAIETWRLPHNTPKPT